MARLHQRGFTLIELIVAMTVAMVVVGFMAIFLTTPVQAYFAQTRRADLADSADAIVRNMSRDIRSALPNSIRISADRHVVEMLIAVDVLRYRAVGESGNPVLELDTTQADSQFSTITHLDNLAEPFASNNHFLVVNHTNAPGSSAYESANVITPVGTAITITANALTGEADVAVNPGFRFAADAPTRNLFVVSGAVAYVCDPATQTLRRYTGYTLAPSIDDNDSDGELMGASATSALVAQHLSACEMDYVPGTAQSGELIGLRMTLESNGETFPLYHQTRVERVP